MVNVTGYYYTKSCHTCSAFSRTEPRYGGYYRRLKTVLHEPKNRSNVCFLSRPRVLPGLQYGGQGYGLGSHTDRSSRDHLSIPSSQSRSSSHSASRFEGCVHVGRDQCGIRHDSCDRFCRNFRAFTSAISSILLSRKMKYLVLGPASMAIYSLIGCLKARESRLADVKEISGSSAGAILALFLALGMSVDEILEISLNLDIPNFVKIRLGSFFTKFGFVSMSPIRKKLVEICGCDPTFQELDMKIYISAFCLNTNETEYFSRDTHPDMKVIDAVCMSMAVPLIFACGNYNGKTYVDGGTQEQYPINPFLDKKPHEVSCVKIKMDRIYQEKVETPKQYVECLVRSSLKNRVEYNMPVEVIDINVRDTNVFNFNMSYEEKVKLYNIGFTSP